MILYHAVIEECKDLILSIFKVLKIDTREKQKYLKGLNTLFLGNPEIGDNPRNE